MANSNEQRVGHRYMRDREGDTYFPVTHIDALLGIENIDLNEDVNNINLLIENLNQTISNQQKVINDLTDKVIVNEEAIKRMRKDIEELKNLIDEPTNPPEEDGE